MRNAVRYKRLAGNRQEKIKQFKKQLNKFERDAKSGKVLCLTDLMSNSEELHTT